MQGPTETQGNVERVLGQVREIAGRYGNGRGGEAQANVEKDFARLEDLWMQAMEVPGHVASRLELFLDTAEGLLRGAGEVTRVGTLLELLLSCLVETTPANLGLRLYWLLLRCFPSKKEYRAGFSERFEGIYPLVSPERAFYEVSGLATSANPSGALSRLEKLLKFKAGAHVFHASGWGVGKVVAVDP